MAFKEANVAFDENLVFLDMNNKLMIDRAIHTIMNKGVDCVVCSDDLICSKVLAKLEEANYIIPEDIRVASFYNNVHLENHNPPITTLSINVNEMGILAIRKLIDMISGEEPTPKTWISYEILIRKSTK